MPTTEFTPVRMELNTDEQIILTMDASDKIVVLKWDDHNQVPYMTFSHLITAPIMKGKFEIYYPTTPYMNLDICKILYEKTDTSISRYYLSYNGNIFPSYSVDTFGKSFTCSECTVVINDGADDNIWKFDFDITLEKRTNGEKYNYITLTGFIISP